MATVTLMLKENKANLKGEMPLYIRITKYRRTKFISLGIKIHPEQWNQEKLRVKGTYPHSGRINALIARKLAEAEEMALSMQIRNLSVSSKKIKEAISGKESLSLIKYMERVVTDLKATGKIGTYDKYNATMLKLKKYINNRDLTFDEFDLQFLKEFERYLHNVLKNKTNTIMAH